MTASQELQIFAQALEPFCRDKNLNFVCLIAEHDMLPGMRLSQRPYLFLAQLAEGITCGHLLPLDTGQNFFVRVRTPLVASSTLKVINLRTYSLILVEHRGLAVTRFERALAPQPARRDIGELLSEATEAVLAKPADELDFLQREELAPLKTEQAELVAWRAAFCSGTVAGSVLSTPASGIQAAEAGTSPIPVNLYTF